MALVPKLVVALLLVLLASPLHAKPKHDPDLFRSEVARLALRKPAGWTFQTLQTALENRAKVKLKDAEFEQALTQLASAPLMIAMRHSEPYEKLNPTVQVIVRPAATLEGKSGVEIMTMVAPALARQFADFAMVDSVRAVTVGERPGARMTVRYTLKTQDGREFPTQATIVMIPRGKALYQIGFSGPAEGPEVIGTEVDSVLASIRFSD